MDHTSKLEYAHYLRSEKKYSCSQAVLCTYASELGLDHDVAYRLAEGFSKGFGGRKEICGAVSAMGMVISLRNSSGVEGNASNKSQTLQLIDEATQKFIEKHNTHMCDQLLNENSDTRTCTTLVLDCIAMLEEANEKN